MFAPGQQVRALVEIDGVDDGTPIIACGTIGTIVSRSHVDGWVGNWGGAYTDTSASDLGAM